MCHNFDSLLAVCGAIYVYNPQNLSFGGMCSSPLNCQISAHREHGNFTKLCAHFSLFSVKNYAHSSPEFGGEKKDAKCAVQKKKFLIYFPRNFVKFEKYML